MKIVTHEDISWHIVLADHSQGDLKISLQVKCGWSGDLLILYFRYGITK